ncbi:MAG: ATP-binding protein [Pseudomonadota bacterium]
MTLRRQLLVFCLVLAALPVAAWQSARQVESFLREARGEAHLATARAIAAGLDQALLPSFSPDDLYVNRVDQHLQVDGYDDEWQLWDRDSQIFDGRRDRFTLSLRLAAWRRELYALIEVRDSSRQRASEQAGAYLPGDHLQLEVRDVRGFTRYRLLPSVPGSLSLLPVGVSTNQLPPPVAGSWRELDEGYRVELVLPRALLGEGLDLTAIDTGEGVGEPQLLSLAEAGGSAPLIDLDQRLSDQLATLTRPGNRSWILHPAGWVLASAGELVGMAENPPGGWQQVAYRLLAGDTLERTRSRTAGVDLRLRGAEIETARRGGERVSWRRVSAASVEAAAAVPLGDSGAVLLLELPADPLLLATNRSALRLLGLTLLVVTVVVLGLLAHSTWLSLRIRRLRDASEQALSRLGEAENAALPGSSDGDEIGDLARSFSGLFGELRSYNQYLKSLASKLSHELNTPLAVVRSSLENLRHESMSDEALAFASRADEGASRLRKILSAMSEATRLEHSLEQTEVVDFDLCDVVSGCVAGYRNVYPEPRWEVDLPTAAPMTGAPELLAQMLDKLADNAAGFCPAGGAIKLRVTALRRGWRLVFGNDGPLLPEAMQVQIFESLVSARSEEDAQVHLGLGLHIVRLIVRAHGGRVVARNRADGSGVEFVMTLASRRRKLQS